MKKTFLLIAILMTSLIGFGQSLPDNILEDECNAPLHGSTWNVHLLYSTPGNPVASYAPIIAGDIDDNGVVDIVMAHYKGNNYRTNILDVYSGLNLSLQYQFSIQDSIYVSNGPYAIGKYPKPDGTQQGAIFVHGYDRKIRSYTINGTLLNVSDRATACDGMVSLADFNGDGYPEVYAGSDSPFMLTFVELIRCFCILLLFPCPLTAFSPKYKHHNNIYIRDKSEERITNAGSNTPNPSE